MAEYVLETKGLGISFGGLKAAQDVNIRIKKNQIYGLIGPNGAGKTTLFNLLTCVYKPTTGMSRSHTICTSVVSCKSTSLDGKSELCWCEKSDTRPQCFLCYLRIGKSPLF